MNITKLNYLIAKLEVAFYMGFQNIRNESVSFGQRFWDYTKRERCFDAFILFLAGQNLFDIMALSDCTKKSRQTSWGAEI